MAEPILRSAEPSLAHTFLLPSRAVSPSGTMASCWNPWSTTRLEDGHATHSGCPSGPLESVPMKAELRLLTLRKQKHDAIAALQEKYDRRIAALVKKLGTNCAHPKEAQAPFAWCWDSGYGRQKTVDGLTCGACGRQKLWAASSLWYFPGEMD